MKRSVIQRALEDNSRPPITMDKFNFAWSQYQLQSKSLLQNIYKGEEFYDVTLVTEDEKFIKAHKVVLAASSEYFQRILSLQSNANPFVILRGISGDILDNIMKFLYLGETAVCQSNMEEFIQVSKSLRIKGLAGETEADKSTEPSNAGAPMKNTSRSSIVDMVDAAVRSFSVGELLQNEDSNDSVRTIEEAGCNLNTIQDLLMEKQQEHIEIDLEEEEDDIIQETPKTYNIGEEEYSLDEDVEEEVVEEVEEVIDVADDQGSEATTAKEPEPETIYCDRCDFETIAMDGYQEHFKNEHVNDILCKDCEFVAKDKDMLKDHMLTTHKGVSCNNCHKKFGDLTLLRKHILANESCMANLF